MSVKRIVIEWDTVEVIHYAATVSVERYSALTGIPVADILAADDPTDLDGPLNLEDELANLEDSGEANETSNEFTREEIEVDVQPS